MEPCGQIKYAAGYSALNAGCIIFITGVVHRCEKESWRVAAILNFSTKKYTRLFIDWRKKNLFDTTVIRWETETHKSGPTKKQRKEIEWRGGQSWTKKVSRAPTQTELYCVDMIFAILNRWKIFRILEFLGSWRGCHTILWLCITINSVGVFSPNPLAW